MRQTVFILALVITLVLTSPITAISDTTTLMHTSAGSGNAAVFAGEKPPTRIRTGDFVNKQATVASPLEEDFQNTALSAADENSIVGDVVSTGSYKGSSATTLSAATETSKDEASDVTTTPVLIVAASACVVAVGAIAIIKKRANLRVPSPKHTSGQDDLLSCRSKVDGEQAQVQVVFVELVTRSGVLISQPVTIQCYPIANERPVMNELQRKASRLNLDSDSTFKSEILPALSDSTQIILDNKKMAEIATTTSVFGSRESVSKLMWKELHNRRQYTQISAARTPYKYDGEEVCHPTTKSNGKQGKPVIPNLAAKPNCVYFGGFDGSHNDRIAILQSYMDSCHTLGEYPQNSSVVHMCARFRKHTQYV